MESFIALHVNEVVLSLVVLTVAVFGGLLVRRTSNFLPYDRERSLNAKVRRRSGLLYMKEEDFPPGDDRREIMSYGATLEIRENLLTSAQRQARDDRIWRDSPRPVLYGSRGSFFKIHRGL